MSDPGHWHLRTSAAERERAIDVLKAAFAEGRLDLPEYTERVGQAQGSRTYGELAALTADLPVGPLGTLPASAPPVPAAPARPALRYPPRGQLTARPPWEPLAIAALIAGVVLIVFPDGELLAFVLGVLALTRIRRTGRRGAGMATAGVVVGGLCVLLAITGLFLAL